MDATGGADGIVERDVVLHRTEVGQACRGHLLALPVLLEPATAVPVNGQFEDREPGYGRLCATERLAEEAFRVHCPFSA
jgi:hypothetical protein